MVLPEQTKRRGRSGLRHPSEEVLSLLGQSQQVVQGLRVVGHHLLQALGIADLEVPLLNGAGNEIGDARGDPNGQVAQASEAGEAIVPLPARLPKPLKIGTNGRLGDLIDPPEFRTVEDGMQAMRVTTSKPMAPLPAKCQSTTTVRSSEPSGAIMFDWFRSP